MERVNQILEDMLRACLMNYHESWDKCLTLAEFSYHKSYQESIKMAPLKALYGRRCQMPLNWIEPGEREIYDPILITKAEETIYRHQANIRTAKTRQ
jgi:hypothetical protein